MNLKTQQQVSYKKRKKESIMPLVGMYSAMVVACLFGIFTYTIYLDGKCEAISENINKYDRKVYSYEREVQNLEVKLEKYKKKDYITGKISEYSLALQTPDDYQVITLPERTTYSYDNTEQLASI